MPTQDSWRNWAGNQSATGFTAVQPTGTAGIAAIGRPEDVQLRLDRHAGLLDVTDDGLVTVQAGMPLHRLTAELAARGWALTNLGDVDRQTISGALSTGTHGTGAEFGGLATQVRAFELVLADGSVLRCSAAENADVFAVGRVGLGALGVLSTVTLQAVPAFALRAQEGPASLTELRADFAGFMTSADHVEFYWFPHTDRCATKRNTRVPLAEVAPLPRWRRVWDDEVLANGAFAAVVAAGQAVPPLVRPLARLAARGMAARTHTDHAHRVFVSRRRVRFQEMEYAAPRAAAPEVLRELQRAVDAADWRVPFPVEVRVAAADDVPLSTASGRETAYIAVHGPARNEPAEYFAVFEAIAGSVGGRPHWGKLHGLDAAVLSGRYPRFAEFTALRDRLHPGGVLSNDHLDRVLGPVPARAGGR